MDFLILEARDRPAGRILSVNAEGAPAEDGFDLGPSWFWPERQPAIGAFVSELGLESFAQNAEGDVDFERMSLTVLIQELSPLVGARRAPARGSGSAP